jgi:5-methylcytosine-specific restriction endonuclease McrA
MCAYCQKDISKEFSIDHIEPITRGGSDDDDNLVACCKSCNSSKNNMSLIIFLATRPRNNVEKYMKRFAR